MLTPIFFKEVLYISYEIINQLIGTLGFPIVCTILMWHQLNKNSELHKEESKQFTIAIENNTKAIQNLTNIVNNIQERLDYYEQSSRDRK